MRLSSRGNGPGDWIQTSEWIWITGDEASISTHILQTQVTDNEDELHTHPALMAVVMSVEVETLVLTVIMFSFIR